MAWPVDGAFTDSPAYLRFTVESTYVTEVPDHFPFYLSRLPQYMWDALATAGDTTGRTFRVTLEGSDTKIAIHVVSIDTGTKTGIILIKGADLSTSVDIQFRIYAGDAALSMAAVTDPDGRNAVLSYFRCFYTMTGASPIDDITGNGLHLTGVGGYTPAGAGPYEGLEGITFNGTTGYLYRDISSDPAFGYPGTVFSLFRSTNTTATQVVAGFSQSGSGNHFMTLVAAGAVASDPIQCVAVGSTGTQSVAATSAGYTANTWYFGVGNRDIATGGTTRVYRNGGSAGSNATSIAPPTITRLAVAASMKAAVGQFFVGRIGITGYSDNIPSANRVATWYHAYATSAFMTTTPYLLTGYITATTITDLGGSFAWTNTANGRVIDGSNATRALLINQFTNILEYTDFDLSSIPEGYTISGVFVLADVEESSSSGFVEFATLGLSLLGSAIGTDKASGIPVDWYSWSSQIVGSNTDLWGYSALDWYDIQDPTFGVRLGGEGRGTTTARVDGLTLQVAYQAIKDYTPPTPPSGPTNKFLPLYA